MEENKSSCGRFSTFLNCLVPKNIDSNPKITTIEKPGKESNTNKLADIPTTRMNTPSLCKVLALAFRLALFNLLEFVLLNKFQIVTAW